MVRQLYSGVSLEIAIVDYGLSGFDPRASLFDPMSKRKNGVGGLFII